VSRRQNAAQEFDVVVVELAIARRGALGFDQTLTLEKSNLRDGDVRKLLEE